MSTALPTVRREPSRGWGGGGRWGSTSAKAGRISLVMFPEQEREEGGAGLGAEGRGQATDQPMQTHGATQRVAGNTGCWPPSELLLQ